MQLNIPLSIPRRLLFEIRDRHYAPRGNHGLAHWGRVREIGLRLAKLTGADAHVVALFALFHDAGRQKGSRDPGHGARGAALAKEFYWPWYRRCFDATEEQMDILCRACARHTSGSPEDAQVITVATCWDADRLDLGRVGITPRAEFLSTQAARDPRFMTWASSLWRKPVDWWGPGV